MTEAGGRTGHSAGTVRRWSGAEGVVDSADTPGGCDVEAFVVDGDPAALRAGQPVTLDWVATAEGFRATRVVLRDDLGATPGA